MAFCTQCGKQLDENTAFCPQCGKAVAKEQEPQQSNQGQAQAAPEQTGQNPFTQPQSGSSLNDFVQTMGNGADTTNQFDPMDIARNKGMAVLSYLGLLFLIPLLASKDSPFAQFR